MDTSVTQPEFITLQERHVGGKVIRAFGKRWRLRVRVLPEDIGRRVYRTEDGIYIEDERAEPGSHPCIFEICAYLNVDLLQEISDNTYALGHSRHDGEITPWFDTIDELELFCEENLDAFQLTAKH